MSAPAVSRFDAKAADVADYLSQVQEALCDLLPDAGTNAQRADLNQALECVFTAKTWVRKAHNH